MYEPGLLIRLLSVKFLYKNSEVHSKIFREPAFLYLATTLQVFKLTNPKNFHKKFCTKLRLVQTKFLLQHTNNTNNMDKIPPRLPTSDNEEARVHVNQRVRESPLDHDSDSSDRNVLMSPRIRRHTINVDPNRLKKEDPNLYEQMQTYVKRESLVPPMPPIKKFSTTAAIEKKFFPDEQKIFLHTGDVNQHNNTSDSDSEDFDNDQKIVVRKKKMGAQELLDYYKHFLELMVGGIHDADGFKDFINTIRDVHQPLYDSRFLQPPPQHSDGKTQDPPVKFNIFDTDPTKSKIQQLDKQFKQKQNAIDAIAVKPDPKDNFRDVVGIKETPISRWAVSIESALTLGGWGPPYHTETQKKVCMLLQRALGIDYNGLLPPIPDLNAFLTFMKEYDKETRPIEKAFDRKQGLLVKPSIGFKVLLEQAKKQVDWSPDDGNKIISRLAWIALKEKFPVYLKTHPLLSQYTQEPDDACLAALDYVWEMRQDESPGSTTFNRICGVHETERKNSANVSQEKNLQKVSSLESEISDLKRMVANIQSPPIRTFNNRFQQTNRQNFAQNRQSRNFTPQNNTRQFSVRHAHFLPSSVSLHFFASLPNVE